MRITRQRVCRDARGRDGGVRKVLAAGVGIKIARAVPGLERLHSFDGGQRK